MNLHPLNAYTIPVIVTLLALLAMVEPAGIRQVWRDWRNEAKFNRQRADEMQRIAAHWNAEQH